MGFSSFCINFWFVFLGEIMLKSQLMGGYCGRKCCQCGKNYKYGYAYCVNCDEKKRTHNFCHQCKQYYPKYVLKHCCNCKFIFKNSIIDANPNMVHCCQCKTTYDLTVESHCCECKKAWDSKTEDHCVQCCSIYNKNIGHCCDCEQLWNPNEQKHCSGCCSVYDNKLNHCCDCRKIWNPVNTQHCCHCKNRWRPAIAVHCKNKNCCVVHSKNLKHCCDCQKIWDPSIDNHCSECCVTYDDNLKHCCKCSKIWNPADEEHCVDCCLSYDKGKLHCCMCFISHDKNNLHCCGCNKSWDPNTSNHCTACHTFTTDNHKHCCRCKNIWDPDSHIHCSSCCCTYDTKMIHCCQCKKEWNPNDYTHCAKCCCSFDNGSKHCCVCGINNACHCKQIMNIIEQITSTHINIWPTNCIVSKCLNTTCDAFPKFLRGIRTLGHLDNNIINFLNDRNNHRFVYHGTPTIEGAKNICCKSWDTSMRSRRAHGDGEYFSTNIGTARDYSDDSGAVVISIVIDTNSSYIKRVYKDDETWYVVKNDNNNAFTLPVAIMEVNTDISSYKACPLEEKKQMLEKICNSDIRIQFYDGQWTDYDNSSKMQIISKIKQGNSTFDIIINNGNVYSIDWNNMTQTNQSSGYRRNIRVM
jgi:WWE domain